MDDELTDWLDGLAAVNYVYDPVEWCVLLRTPDHWRVLLPTPDGTPDEREFARLPERLLGVHDPSRPWRIAHASMYRVHQRVAETFRAGRVLLAGDAAHVNNPLGGLGMNSGIHDAVAYANALTGGTTPRRRPPIGGGSPWNTCRASRIKTTSGCAMPIRPPGKRTWTVCGRQRPIRSRPAPPC